LLLYTREKLRKFGQKEYKNRTQIAIVNSKMLYEALRPYKQKDFHWEIPKFLTTQESITGFLQGLYDAEGFIERHNKKYFHSIGLCSKHKSNLLQIQQILSNFGFDTKMYQHFSNSAWYLHIFSKEQALKFQNLVGFQLPRKKNLLEVIL